MGSLLLEKSQVITATIVGLSHLVNAKTWVRFFDWLIEEGVASIVIAGLHLPLGVLLLLLHPAWTFTPGVIFTILGYGLTMKGTLYLIFPHLPKKVIRAQRNGVRNMRFAGAMLLLLTIPMWLAISSG